MPNRFGPGCKCCHPSAIVRAVCLNCFPNDTGNVQQVLLIFGSPSGGTFTLTYGPPIVGGFGQVPETTSAIAYDASADDVENALAALSDIGSGNISCSGGPLPDTPVTIAFEGDLADKKLNVLSAAGNFTGGTLPFIEVDAVSNNIPPSATATLVSDEQQQVSLVGNPTGGSFTLSFGGETTDPIQFPCTAAAIQSALETLSAIPSGGVLVTGDSPIFTVVFEGALGAQQLPLLGADGSGLTGGDNPDVSVTELFAGGNTIGPVSIDDQTGITYIPNVPAPSYYEATVSAPGYEDIEQTIDVLPGGLNQIGGQMTVVDGDIVTDGKPSPVAAPATANLIGDPGGLASLNLMRCTGGLATYLGTAGPTTFDIGTPGNPFVISKQVWFVAKFGCGQTLDVYWTMSVVQTPPNRSFCEPIPGSIEQLLQCLPTAEQDENALCDWCACTALWWNFGGLPPGANLVHCGPINPDAAIVGSLSAGWTIGGGCFSIGPVFGLVKFPGQLDYGYTGSNAAAQIATIWPNSDDQVIKNNIVCVSASL